MFGSPPHRRKKAATIGPPPGAITPANPRVAGMTPVGGMSTEGGSSGTAGRGRRTEAAIALAVRIRHAQPATPGVIAEAAATRGRGACGAGASMATAETGGARCTAAQEAQASHCRQRRHLKVESSTVGESWREDGGRSRNRRCGLARRGRNRRQEGRGVTAAAS